MRRLTFVTTAAAVALLSAASAQDAEQVTPNAAAPTQASAAAAGPLADAITAYAAFHSDISNLRTSRIGSANDLEDALNVASRHNRDGLTRGFVAYGAYTAAQSPEFVEGVRAAASYYGRDAVIWAITADTRYARSLRGGREATRLVLDSASADSARILNVADRYQELAYGLQRQRWANAVAPQQAARVQRVRSLNAGGSADVALPTEMTARLQPAIISLSPRENPTVFGGRRFWDHVSGGGGEAQVVEVASQVSYSWRLNESRGEAVNRMTSIAALQALNAIEERRTAVDQMMSDPRSRDCLEMAQLQLYQCMSAARFRYENAFCMGQHAIRNIGECIGDIATPDTSGMTPIVGASTAPVGAASRH
jgi:hypothetical protein